MKLAFIATLFMTLFATLVAAVPAGGANAARLARGMSPLPPVRRHASRVLAARQSAPSGAAQCAAENINCCESLGSSNDPVSQLLAGLLGIVLPSNVVVGLTCTVANLLGGATCSGQTVCCTGNNFDGLISLGCTPISIL